MPYARPTLTQLRQQAMQDLNAANIGLNGFLRFAVVGVVAWVQAGLAYLHYGYLDYIAQQSNPVGATDENALLWGGLIGVQIKGATTAELTATFLGTSNTSVLGYGTNIVRGDQTAYIVTTAGGANSDNLVTVGITAVAPGSAGNCDNGTPLSLSIPISGMISNSGLVIGTTTPGTDQEDINTSYKTRYLAQYAAPPQGGDRADYIEWAEGIPGVTRAWVAPQLMGAGTVGVYFMMDAVDASNGGFPYGANGVAANEPRDAPATSDKLAVANALFAVQPVTALVYALGPTPEPVPFTITGLGVNNTTAMLALIEAALSGMFLQYANVGGTVNPVDGSPWPAIEPNAWYTALAAIPGLTTFAVASPSGPITPATGSLFTLGTVTPSS